MGDQRPRAAEFQKLRQNLPDFGSAAQHVIRNSGEIYNFLRQGAAGIYEALKPADFLASL